MRFPLWTRDGIPTRLPQDMATWLERFDAGKLPNATRVSASQIEFHHGTLLDGEMVVNKQQDGRQQRVFYVYDLMMLNGANVSTRPWKVSTAHICWMSTPCNLPFAWLMPKGAASPLLLDSLYAMVSAVP
jgi:hypothetical protein